MVSSRGENRHAPDHGGELFVVATPIGNLDDMSPRGLDALRGAGLIAAEDTRRTRKLLTRFNIAKKLISCHKHNERKRAEEIMAVLENGENVAMVTDAGTPGLSDPGSAVIRRVADAGFKVCPIPGPSAVATALSVSGMPADFFLFAGFLPSRKNARVKLLLELKDYPHTILAFEAPHRLVASLRDMLEILGDREIFLAREMTKLHETFVAGTISAILEKLEKEPVKGEITLVLSGAGERAAAAQIVDREALVAILKGLVSGGSMGAREATALVMRLTGLPKSVVYPLALQVKRKCEKKNAEADRERD